MKSSKSVTLSSGRVVQPANLTNEECERLGLVSELARRPKAQPRTVAPTRTAKVHKQVDGKDVEVEVVVGGYVPFSGGSQEYAPGKWN